MRVLYDHQIFQEQEFGGISRYFWEIIRIYKNDPNLNIDVSLKVSNNQYVDKSVVPFVSFMHGKRIKGKGRLMNIVNTWFSKSYINTTNFDIFHPTYYSTYYLKNLKKPFILTIHDMIHERFSSKFPDLRNEKLIRDKEILAHKAARIIAVSEHTKNDILKYYNKIDESKIEVVYHGNSVVKSINLQHLNVDLPDQYILFVGTRNHYKNFCFFLKACSTFLANNRGFKIILAGGGSLRKEEKEMIKRHVLSDQLIHFDRINNSLLQLLYEKAFAFIFPSLYEGFGIPILEGFSMGVPVLTSNTSSLAEIGGDSTLKFDPYDESDLIEKLEMIKDDTLRNNLVKKGYKRIKLFNWESTAEKTLEVYRSMI